MYESDVENAALAWFEDQGWRSYLVKGVEVECLGPDGTDGYESVLVIDYDEPDDNVWLVVNQFTVTEARGASGLRSPSALLADVHVATRDPHRGHAGFVASSSATLAAKTRNDFPCFSARHARLTAPCGCSSLARGPSPSV